MKSLMASLLLVLSPIIVFIISFYFTGKILSREIRVADFITQVSNFINEPEIYKPILREYLRYTLLNGKNETNESLIFKAYYTIFKISILEKTDKRILYEVKVFPKEEISNLKILVHYIDEITIE